MASDTSGLIFDQNGNARGSFTGHWILTRRGGRIEGESVVFSIRDYTAYEPEPSLTLLGDFVDLADGDPRDITRFARKHGALGLCEHGLPFGHREGKGRCRGQVKPGDDVRESLRAWRHYAARARAILNLAASVEAGRDGDPARWKVLGSRSMLGRRGAPIPSPGDREYQKQYLAHEVRTWLNECGARPAITWEESAPRFRLSCASLIGVIGIALMSAILKSGSIVTCSACGLPYTPKRRPAARRNHYCGRCGEDKKAAKRVWARKHRDLKRTRP